MAGYDLSRAVWRRSSYSGQNGNCVEVAVVLDEGPWRASTHSGVNGSCVEVGAAPGVVAVRDSKDRTGPVLAFSPADWSTFTTQIKAASLNLR